MKVTVYKTLGEWDYDMPKMWVGGRFLVSNLSGGYHGLLKQWWDKDFHNFKECLLISENGVVKKEFGEYYQNSNFKTLDFYENMNEDVDLKYNLCHSWKDLNIEKFDCIICQATFEHLYDPVTALKNLTRILKNTGKIYIHTHVPGFEYHQYPRDYFRFYPDWFFDAEEFVGNIELEELCVVDFHIFAAYVKKEKNNE